MFGNVGLLVGVGSRGVDCGDFVFVEACCGDDGSRDGSCGEVGLLEASCVGVGSLDGGVWM